jgi:hypothetical protein
MFLVARLSFQEICISSIALFRGSVISHQSRITRFKTIKYIFSINSFHWIGLRSISPVVFVVWTIVDSACASTSLIKISSFIFTSPFFFIDRYRGPHLGRCLYCLFDFSLFLFWALMLMCIFPTFVFLAYFIAIWRMFITKLFPLNLRKEYSFLRYT